ncbi:hypothetical protein OQA88_5209 [Cercophora sp. LCS_1]
MGESLGPQKAIVYNCRTTSHYSGDLALCVTHFPQRKLTLAILFGASEEDESRVLARLKRAGADAAHPMLLPGILAELERVRQMRKVDEMIEEIEEQISRLDSDTLAGQTKAQRNQQKTKAWLDTAYSKNLLLANAEVLTSMRAHLDEFSMLMNPFNRRCRCMCQTMHYQTSNGSWCTSGSETVFTLESGRIDDPDVEYQKLLYEAGKRMDDRLVSMISEYEEKIRTCVMEIDGIAMATQWSHGETNMEIATATGEDSSQMRSIAVVTMVFLPGTFFAHVFDDLLQLGR